MPHNTDVGSTAAARKGSRMIQPGNIVIVFGPDNEQHGPFRIERLPDDRGYWDLCNEAGQAVALYIPPTGQYAFVQQNKVCSFCFRKVETIIRGPWDMLGADAEGTVVKVRCDAVGCEWGNPDDGEGGVAHEHCFETKRKGTQWES